MISIEMTGIKEVQQLLKDIPIQAIDAVWDDVQEGGLNVESGAKERCPTLKVPRRINGQLYSGGRLKSSIHTSIYPDERKVTVGTDVYYGPYVENGTVNMRAQPFLYPAFEAERGPLIKRVETTIAQVLGGKRR